MRRSLQLSATHSANKVTKFHKSIRICALRLNNFITNIWNFRSLIVVTGGAIEFHRSRSKTVRDLLCNFWCIFAACFGHVDSQEDRHKRTHCSKYQKHCSADASLKQLESHSDYKVEEPWRQASHWHCHGSRFHFKKLWTWEVWDGTCNEKKGSLILKKDTKIKFASLTQSNLIEYDVSEKRYNT